MNIKPAILKTKVNTDNKTNIKIRVVHERKSREIATDFYIDPTHWDATNCRVNTKKNPNAGFVNAELKKKVLEYEQKLLSVPAESWTIERIVAFLKSDNKSIDRFYDYFEKFIARKCTENKRTAEIYSDTLTKIKALNLIANPTFSDITVTVLKDMESNMRNAGMKINSISMHLKNIRAVFNAAIDEEIVGLELYPFRRMTIKSEKGASKALTIEQLNSIRDMADLQGVQSYVRDMFMMSFYLIGINNGDLYAIKGIESDGRIKYARAKTHRQYSIKIEPEASALIEKHKGIDYLVSLAERYGSTKAVNVQLNKNLKHIGAKIGVAKLTMYHARHTWATIAAQLEIPKETISAALGHGGNTVTDIYISFDDRKIDEANRKVIDRVNGFNSDR